MTAILDEKAILLIDVELPHPAPIEAPLRAMMGGLKIILVGWYAVPDQTTPEQARDQFGGEAQVALDRIAATFRGTGAEVQTHVVFTGDELHTIERISAEQDCDAVLIPKPITSLQRVLVPVRGLHNARRIAHFVADLVQDGTTDVTLLHVLEKMATLVAEEGIDAGLIRRRVERASDPGESIIGIAKDYDVVVIGETDPSVREVIFGSVPEQIAHKAEVPVMVVRRRDGYD